MPVPPRIVRLTSVFEPPREVLEGRGASFDPIGGMQNHTACLTRALDARGVHQDVVTTRPPGAPAQQVVGERATVHRLGLPVRTLRQLYAPGAARAVHRLAAGASLVHVHLGEDLAVVPIGLSAARRHGIPFVLTIHLSLQHTLAGGSPHARFLRGAGGRLEALGAARADAVIALAPRLARLLLDDGVDPQRVHVIPSGVVPADFAAADRSDPLVGVPRPRVLFVGRLAFQKGVGTLVEAAARLRTPDAQVVLVGDGPERAELERQVARLGLADRVSFLGFRSHDEIPAILQAGDVMVLPSRYEELGSVLLEGLQAGLPIVASATGGIPDALDGAGVLVAPGDPAELAAAIDGLLADPAERARLSAAARERAGDFDWDDLAARVHDVYEQVLPGRRSAVAPLEPSLDA